ncbi:MAG: glycoside hydrolase family 18 [Dysgonamonadaceae bacterium]|jgi:hypothetical protein|nr:glycoside hydrolase family 18 [Dysgonamonadaceae bacterium]
MKTTIFLFLSVALTAFFTACSDWTTQEPLDIVNPSIEDANSPAYLEYLANVRKYKQTYHPLMIGIFDNSDKTFQSRATRIKAVPDKVDIVSLMYPDDLAEIELEDIASIRKDKGTKIIYTIAYEDLRQYVETTNFDIEVENALGQADPNYVPKPLLSLATEASKFMDAQLALIDKYEYDGFILHYTGSATHFLKDDEIAEMQAIQDIVFGKALATMNTHPDKTYILEGRPQNVLDKSILPHFDSFLIRTQYLGGISDFTLLVKQTLLDPKVPSNSILVCASAIHTDENDYSWGEITGADGSLKQNAIVETAYWVKTTDTFTKAGMAVYLINRDYFNPDLDYKHVREAIEIMNPSPVN